MAVDVVAVMAYCSLDLGLGLGLDGRFQLELEK